MSPLRSVIAGQVLRLVGRRDGDTPFLVSERDAGYFGPDSAAWKVHGDFQAIAQPPIRPLPAGSLKVEQLR